MKMFEMAKIDEAKDLHDKLSNLYARSNIDPKQISEAKDILYRAYTHYKQAADHRKGGTVLTRLEVDNWVERF